MEKSDAESSIATDGADTPFPLSPRVRYLPDGTLTINGKKLLIGILEREPGEQAIPMTLGDGIASRPLDCLQAAGGAHDFLVMMFSAGIGARSDQRVAPAGAFTRQLEDRLRGGR